MLTLTAAVVLAGGAVTVPPGGSIQDALDGGATAITLQAGTYNGPIVINKPGVTITGPETGTDPAGRFKTVVQGTGHVIDVDASNVILSGFTVYGQPKVNRADYPTRLEDVRVFKMGLNSGGQVNDGRLIYIGNKAEGVNTVTIDNMAAWGAGGECIRARSNASGIKVTNSLIAWCGMYAKDDKGGEKDALHNGEGVYFGTSPKSTNQPLAGRDNTRDSDVIQNVIWTYGSECVNTKEATTRIRVLFNNCYGNIEGTDHDGSLIELRGNDGLVVGNWIGGSYGAGIKVRADDGPTTGNAWFANALYGLVGPEVLR